VELVRPALCFVEAGVRLPGAVTDAAVIFDPLDDAAHDTAGTLFSEWLDAADGADSAVPPAPVHHETAAILLSSGTTGRPKAIVHSFANLLRGSIKLATFYRLEPGTRMLSAGDFHSMSGLRNAAVLSLVNAHTVLLADGAGAHMALRFLDIARVYRPRLVFSSPALIETLARTGSRLEARHCASIDAWLCTGAPVSSALLGRLSAEWNIRFATYYGLTETGGFCAGTRLGQTVAEGDLGEPVGAVFKLVDATGDTVVGEGVGSLQVFSDQLMTGYLASPDPRHEGWLATGDKVRRTADGALILLGRGEDEFSNAAGELVNLAYLETELGPVVEVGFALLHDSGGLTLVVECSPAEFEILQQSRALDPLLTQLSTRGIGALSELRLAHVQNIPRTGNGKIQRSVLQQELVS
jgi:acyl-coenzyme A synthetase/AMP-(fatty) acid ligase